MSRDALSDVVEILALVLLCAAGFAAPTDWNITLGLALVAIAVALVSFALSAETTEPEADDVPAA